MLNIKANVQRLRAHFETPFYNNAYSLIGLQISTAFLGFLFWLVVAHLFSPSQLGIGSALLSLAMLVLGFADLGLDDGLAYYLPTCEDKPSMVNAYFSISAIAGILFTIAVILLQPLLSTALHQIRSSLFLSLLFFTSTLVLHLNGMQDALFVAQRTSKYMFFKGVLINLLRIPVVLALLIAMEWSQLLSLALASLVGLVVFSIVYVKKIDPLHQYRIDLRPKIWLPIMGFSLSNYMTGIMASLPGTLIPLIVINMLGAKANAYFYIAWTITNMINVIGRSFGVTLFVEGRAIPDSINRNILRSTVVSLVMLSPAVLLLVFFAGPLLNLFGHEYSFESAVSVRILACSGIPITIYGIAVGVLKAQGKIAALILTGLIFVVFHIFGSWWGAQLAGVTGVAWAIMVTRTMSAALAAGLALQKPRVVR